jgi:hypothetical protein
VRRRLLLCPAVGGHTRVSLLKDRSRPFLLRGGVRVWRFRIWGSRRWLTRAHCHRPLGGRVKQQGVPTGVEQLGAPTPVRPYYHGLINMWASSTFST